MVEEDELAAAVGDLREVLREWLGPLIGTLERFLMRLVRRVERMGD